MRIIPALLTAQKEELKKMLEKCASFTSYVQVDIMDGKFVPSLSITLDDVRTMRSPFSCEAHLMVEDPLSWIEPFREFGAEKIIFHFEADIDHRQVIRAIKAQGLKAGLAVNPDTSLNQFKPLVSDLDSVLFMSVVPGFYGSPFLPEVLSKIAEFRKEFPLLAVGIDGGVNTSNVKAIASLGVEDICVGSALMKAADPVSAYKNIIETANG